MARNDLPNDHAVSYQWAKRPDDERFLSLESLRDSIERRTERSNAFPVKSNQLMAVGTDEGELMLATPERPLKFSNWSFGQLASAAEAPASYLRKIPSPLAADCINWGLRNSKRDENLLLADTEAERLRALTSVSYGRIWDIDVVKAVMNINEKAGGIWRVPAASSATGNSKRATTLYASDRDVFMFLCDEEHPIDWNGEKMFRGFYCWNSETGSAVFGVATFLYRYLCDNRIIWSQAEKHEIRIRHTSGAPERFLREATPALKEYANASTEKVVTLMKKAKAIEVGKADDDVLEWIKKQGFTASFSKRIYDQAVSEEGRCASVWEVAQGLSALARSNPHTDTRIQLEKRAGKLIEVAAS
jgi:hypothetical protein